MELFNHATVDQLASSFSFIALYFFIFFLAKWINGLVSSFNLDEQLTEKDNVAAAISVGGYFIGITIIFAGALSGPSAGTLGVDIAVVTGYTIGGIALLIISRIINQKLILYKFSTVKEIIEDQNPGTGVVEAGSYVASALIIAGSIHGEGGGPLITLVFYAIGQACLVLFGLLYAKITPYSLHDEIEQDNVAAGLGFAGGLVAIGIILMRAVSGDFVSWSADLTAVAIDVVIVFIYIIGVRFIFDKFILRNSDLMTEISKDKNIGAGLLEMLVAICFAVALFFLM